MSNNTSALDFIQLSVDVAKIVNYVGTQNKVPIIHYIRLENTSDIDIKHLELSIGSNPGFIEGQRFKFEKFAAGEIRGCPEFCVNGG
ncbi:hypothetical protein [Methylophilus sp. 5]|uniref:hypothetical protein n=1 Tax=Methylophilus sp. 5 TaxID=1112274 RepID=UPI00048C7846|nr:hypothetical protein [Methylophilus sp. 5]